MSKAAAERLSANVRRLRTGLGLTQAGLGARLERASSVVSDIEGGRRGASLAMLDELAVALECDVSELLAS